MQAVPPSHNDSLAAPLTIHVQHLKRGAKIAEHLGKHAAHIGLPGGSTGVGYGVGEDKNFAGNNSTASKKYTRLILVHLGLQRGFRMMSTAHPCHTHLDEGNAVCMAELVDADRLGKRGFRQHHHLPDGGRSGEPVVGGQ